MADHRQGPLASRLVWLAVGLAALAAATVGILLPLIPTTPFVLVAAFAFMKSSRRLHGWLINHYLFGPIITDWREYGAISRIAKILSIATMVVVFAVSLALQVPGIVLAIQALVLGVCMWFIGSRPLPPDQPPSS